jgi:hypothetical protein
MRNLEKFFDDINELKHTERQGWKDIEVERPRIRSLPTASEQLYSAGRCRKKKAWIPVK